MAVMETFKLESGTPPFVSSDITGNIATFRSHCAPIFPKFGSFHCEGDFRAERPRREVRRGRRIQ
jgi:hypothetical protein